MATIGNTVPTLIDWAKGQDPDGKVARVVELLGQTNELLTDMAWKEGNLPTGHVTTVRTGLPSVAWRLINNGITPSKSTKAQITEQCGMLEAWSEVDKDLADLNGNAPEFRLSEGMSFIEAMNQEMAQTLVYGNSGAAPEEFTGLAPRYSALSGAANAQNVITAAGGGSDNTSVWLIGWGENSIHGIFPKGSKAGIVHEDEGLVTIETANGIGGGRMKAYRDHWQWKCGIALRDWRYVVRIPNIDVSNLVGESSAADLIKLMSRAIDRLPSLSNVRPAFYMNRTVLSMLKIQALNKSNSALAVESALNQFTTTFQGIPLRKVDQILNTEAAVA